MAKYIYSTMSADNSVAIYEKDANNKQAIKGSITIKGKANVMDKRLLISPKEGLTILEDKEYELIKDNCHFKKWVENGFITVQTKKVEDDKVSKDMTKKDKSAQKKAEDYKSLDAKIVTEEV